MLAPEQAEFLLRKATRKSLHGESVIEFKRRLRRLCTRPLQDHSVKQKPPKYSGRSPERKPPKQGAGLTTSSMLVI